jgi:two-component system NtrC family sensor kinase
MENSLQLLAEATARLASGIGSPRTLVDVAGIMSRSASSRNCRLWIRSRSGDRFRLVADSEAAQSDVEAEQVAMWLREHGHRRDPVRTADGRVRIPLVTDGPPLGLVEAADTGNTALLSMLQALAGAVALWVASTELSEDLASEVAFRTREIDAHRRFTTKIIDSLPVGLYVIDREYSIQAWNRKRETGTQGISREQAIGRPVFDVLRRQPRALLREEFDTVFRTGTMQQLDTESRISGETRYYRITKIPMRLQDEQVTHVITIGEDVTEWRLIQHQISQTEKLAAIGQLAAGVMHELNNPLATIGACVEALTVRLPDVAPAARLVLDEYLHIVETELDRCQAIVDGLLDFSHPRAHVKKAEQINAVVEDSLFLVKHHDRYRGIHLVRQLEGDLPPVHANAKQLIQVFLALMLNAIDAMEGEGTLTVSTRRNTARADEVIVEFTDTGFGIARENLGKIFDPFFTTKVTGRGSGLGLSICYGIVQEHGGRINVESQLGRGATFRVFLPATARVPELQGTL